MEEEALKGLEGPVPHEVAHEARRVAAHGEMEIDAGDIRTPHLDLFHPPDAETVFVGHPDKPYAHGVEPHEMGGHRIEGNRIGAREEEAFFHGDHGAGTGPVAADGCVHDRKEA